MEENIFFAIFWQTEIFFLTQNHDKVTFKHLWLHEKYKTGRILHSVPKKLKVFPSAREKHLGDL